MESRWLIQSALTNAATVVLLAAVAVLIGRCLRRPALTHALWVLVLVKFVTPPLVGVPIPSEWMPAPLTDHFRNCLVYVSEPVEQPPAAPHRVVSDSDAVEEHHRVTPGAGVAALPARTGGSSQSAALPVVVRSLLLLWLAGTGIYFLGFAARIAQFSLRLRTAIDGMPEADERAGEIGRGLGLRRIPAVTFIAQPSSPMLWGLGRFTRVVFPAALWNQLSPPCRDALLTHELAHYRRCDHWVRPLEILVTGLFWWHPVIWWARREIEAAEEACCDARVVRQPHVAPRTYAEALLATVDYIASDSPSAIPATTGIGGAPDLRHRLRRIMQLSDSPSLPGCGRWILLVIVLLLPLQPFVADPASATTGGTIAADAGAVDLTPSLTDEPESGAGNPDSRDEGARPTGWWTWSPGERWADVESADGRFRLLAVTGNRVFLEDRATGRRTDLGQEHVTAVAFAPDSLHFVSASSDGTVRLWNAAEGEAESFLGPHDTEVVSVAVSPMGDLAASGSRDGALLIWDLGATVVRATWTDSRRPIASVRFASDGRTIAVASGDWRSSEPARITLLRLESGAIEPARTLRLPRSIAAIEFTSADRALLAAAWDGTVVRWDLVTGTDSPAGTVDRSLINAASFSPDARFAGRIQPPTPIPPTPPIVPGWPQFADGPALFPEPLTRRNEDVLTAPDELR